MDLVGCRAVGVSRPPDSFVNRPLKKFVSTPSFFLADALPWKDKYTLDIPLRLVLEAYRLNSWSFGYQRCLWSTGCKCSGHNQYPALLLNKRSDPSRMTDDVERIDILADAARSSVNRSCAGNENGIETNHSWTRFRHRREETIGINVPQSSSMKSANKQWLID